MAQYRRGPLLVAALGIHGWPLALLCLAAPALAQPPSTPTVPPVVVESSKVFPSYPLTAKRLGIQGTTMLRIHVREDGQVGEVKVEQSAGHDDLDQAAVDAVRRWRFEPARRGGEAVTAWVRLPVNFKLESGSAPGNLPVPKPTLKGDRLVFSSPAFSFTLPEGWRLATPPDVARIEIYQNLNERRQKALEGLKAGLQFTRVAPFSDLIVRGADATSAALLLGAIAKGPTVLTDKAGAYISVEVTDNPSATRYPPGHLLSERERDEFWKGFSRVTAGPVSDPAKPALALRSLEAKDYPDSTAIVLVYTEEGLLGSLVWTVAQFRSETSVVSFRHGAPTTNPTNRLGDLEAMTTSFRFEK
jgi:TonB family protein